MNKLYILEDCNDIEELRKECLRQRHILFLIGEYLVKESKQEMSCETTIKKIRQIMTDCQ